MDWLSDNTSAFVNVQISNMNIEAGLYYRIQMLVFCLY